MDLESLREQKKKKILTDFEILDLTSNDAELLDKLSMALVLLEEHERAISKLLISLRENPEDTDIISSLQKLNDTASRLRNDISKFQSDLGITRKQRLKNTESQDVFDYIEKLKKAARAFAEYRTKLVFCDECNILIGQVWWKNPSTKGNSATFVCPKCKKVMKVNPNTNKSDRHPSNFKRVPQYL